MHISVFWFLFTAFCCFAGGVVASARYYGKAIVELHKVIATLSNMLSTVRVDAQKAAKAPGLIAQDIKKTL